MLEFFHDNVFYVESVKGGFQLTVSWGLAFGVPLTFFGIVICRKVAKFWHGLTNKDTQQT